MSTPLWLHLHFPLLALEAQINVEQRETPTALLDQVGERVKQCNLAAAESGVHTAMPLATACSLCPTLQVLIYQEQHEQQALNALALWAGSFSAQVVVKQPQGVLLEIASMLHCFGGLSAFMAALTQKLQLLEHQVCYATAHTPLGAQLLACAGVQHCSTDITEHKRQLEALSVDALQLPVSVVEKLSSIGVGNLAVLRRLPVDGVARRYGRQVTQHLECLWGERADPQSFFQPPMYFQQSIELMQEICRAEAVLFPLRRLLAALQGYLRSRDLLTQQLDIMLTFTNGEIEHLIVSHSVGARDAEQWMALCQLKMERTRLVQPAIAIELRVDTFCNPQPLAEDLFAQAKPAESVASLLSRLQIRLGDGAIQSYELVDDHRPEASFRSVPAKQVRHSLSDPLPRPHWLLLEPVALSSDQLAQLEFLHGPERISSGWWDEQPVRRDYYSARYPDNRIGWLFRDDLGHWYTHGWYA